ncbi:MAG: hypothetical protein FJ102_21415 [Deltaproteobacteria bacterium]|nr:hypothetical protein [Deltaproteobacteria bacterium]
MNPPRVRFVVQGGRSAGVLPGGIVGRMPTASLRLADPRVPEAAALVSLRGRDLHLLALRGTLEVDGQADDDIVLAEGQRIVVAGAVELAVEGVDLPARVLAVALPGQVRELCAPVYSLVLQPAADLVPAYVEGAPARAWSTAEGWAIDVGQGPERLVAGREWTVAGVPLRAVEIELAEAAASPTASGGPRLTLVVRSTTVHVQRPSRQPYALDGLAARLVTELALMGAPAPWDVVAREIWGKDYDLPWLRANWDRTLRRLRHHLREAGVREDLVRGDGRGNVELYLYPGDAVVDEA